MRVDSQDTNQGQQSRMRYIDDISFYRDLSNDLHNEYFSGPLKILENKAFSLMYDEHDLESGNARLTVAVVGSFSSGKSTFINSILGRNVCPVNACPTTSSITTFIYSDQEKVERLNDQQEEAITISEYQDNVTHSKESSTETKRYEFKYYYPFDGLRNIELVDTPGFENAENHHDETVTIQSACDADIILFVMDVNKGEISKSVRDILQQLQKDTKAEWYIILNKADTKGIKGGQRIQEKIAQDYGDAFKEIYLYSATSVLKKEVQTLQPIIHQLEERIRVAIEHGDKFNAHITGEKKAASYKLMSDDGTSVDISTSKRQVGVTRKELLDVFVDFSKHKNNLCCQRIASDTRDYQQQKKEMLRGIQGYIQQSLEKNNKNAYSENSTFINSFEKKTDTLLNNYRDRLYRLVCSQVKQHFIAEETPEETRPSFFSPYGWIYIETDKILQQLDRHDIWNQMQNDYSSIASALDKDLGFPLMREKLPENMRKIKKKILSEWASILKALDHEINNDKFDSVDDARKEREQVIARRFDKDTWIRVFYNDMFVFIGNMKGELKHHQGISQGKKEAKNDELDRIQGKIEEFLDIDSCEHGRVSEINNIESVSQHRFSFRWITKFINGFRR